jgi:uncharacterized protein (DUF1800 family)
MAKLTEQRRIAHLLRRAGFGATADETALYAQLGFDGAVQRLLDYQNVPNNQVDSQVTAMEGQLDMTRLPSIQAIWLYRILNTQRPLEEKMMLFWHNLFATANFKVGNPQLMYAQHALFRTNALGSFRDLLYGVSRDPAMLRWLDSNSNRKASPNENYARELMELFTLGVGNYTETDVRESARAFTGWFYDRNQGFLFNRNQHDFGQKTFLGRTGDWDGDDIVNIILEQPAAAEFMARKFFNFFVHDHSTPSTVARLADTFRGSGYSTRELMRAILTSPEFSSDEAYHAVVKSPVDYLVGTMKTIGIGEYSREAVGQLQRMGMALYNPPDVSGWDWGTDWIGAATLLDRLNAANSFATARGDNARFGLDPAALVQRLGARTPQQIADGLLNMFVDGDVPQAVRDQIVAYMTRGYSGAPEAFTQDAARLDRTVRGAAHLVMTTPMYQMA